MSLPDPRVNENCSFSIMGLLALVSLINRRDNRHALPYHTAQKLRQAAALNRWVTCAAGTQTLFVYAEALSPNFSVRYRLSQFLTPSHCCFSPRSPVYTPLIWR